jgi:prevent-host-death family protein
MKYFTAKDAKNQFGRLLDTARSEPVLIAKHGRPVAVVVAFEEYERLDEVERSYWAGKAVDADEEGYLEARASGDLINGHLELKN